MYPEAVEDLPNCALGNCFRMHQDKKFFEDGLLYQKKCAEITQLSSKQNTKITKKRKVI